MIPLGPDFPWLTSTLAALAVIMPVLATVHITMTRRDPRGAMGWIGTVWLAPFVGTLLYVVFGINRIRRKATRLRPMPIHPKMRQNRRGQTGAHEAAGLMEMVGNVTGLLIGSTNNFTPGRSATCHH